MLFATVETKRPDAVATCKLLRLFSRGEMYTGQVDTVYSLLWPSPPLHLPHISRTVTSPSTTRFSATGHAISGHGRYPQTPTTAGVPLVILLVKAVVHSVGISPVGASLSLSLSASFSPPQNPCIAVGFIPRFCHPAHGVRTGVAVDGRFNCLIRWKLGFWGCQFSQSDN